MNNLWWGYLHINGNLLLKRFLDFSSIEDAKEGMNGRGFVVNYCGPFEAEDSEKAMKFLENKLGFLLEKRVEKV